MCMSEVGFQAESQLGECMLYNLAEWAKEHLPEWLEQSVVERSMPAASASVDPVAHTTAKEVPIQFQALQKYK